MHILYLHDMRSPKAEMVNAVARAETRAELEAFVASETAPGYCENGWAKNFRKGGPLEWFNPPRGIFGDSIRDVGTLEGWIEEAVQQAKQSWDDMLATVPEIPE